MHNRIRDAFDGVRADEALKKKLLKKTEERRNEKPVLGFYRKAMVATATCLLVLCLGWVGYYLYFTPITVISVDVNPSVELGVNRFDKVVTVTAFNDEGARIINSVNVQHLNYKDAVDKLLDTTDFSDYAERDGLVYITVFGNDAKSDTVTERLTQHTKERQDVRCSLGEGKHSKEAHNFGLSMGKYEAYLKLKSVDPDVSVEDVKGLTMRQIKDKIEGKFHDKEGDDREHGFGCDNKGNNEGEGKGGNKK